MNNLEMILFDLDGTLLDTLDITVETINEVLQKNNLDITVSKTVVENGMGSSSKEVAQMYMPTLDEEKRMSLLKEMDKARIKRVGEVGGNLYPNLEKVLQNLKAKYKLAIVSNCGAGYIESFLEYYEFGKYFDDYMAASKYGISKAEAIKTVIQRNKIEKAIYVGDTPKDANAANGANIPFIFANYGFGKVENPEHVINNLLELEELLNMTNM